MNLLNFLRRLIKDDGFELVDANSKSYIIGKPKKETPIKLKILDKSFNPKLIKKMSDEEAINYLSTLRQIGRWSAEMILLFTLNRKNIWPVQDIGLLRAISNNYNKKYLPPKKFVNYLNLLPPLLSLFFYKLSSYNVVVFQDHLL